MTESDVDGAIQQLRAVLDRCRSSARTAEESLDFLAKLDTIQAAELIGRIDSDAAAAERLLAAVADLTFRVKTGVQQAARPRRLTIQL